MTASPDSQLLERPQDIITESFSSATANGVLSEADVLSLAFIQAPSTPPRTPKDPTSPPPAPRRMPVVMTFPPRSTRQSSTYRAHATPDVSSIVAVGESRNRGRSDVVDSGTLNTRMAKLVECSEGKSPDLSGSAHVAQQSRDMQPQLVQRADVNDLPGWTANADRRDFAAERIAGMLFSVPEFPAKWGPSCDSHAAPTGM